jgi:hypothetical protein
MSMTRALAATAVAVSLLLGLGPGALGQEGIAVDVGVDQATADLARAEATVADLRRDLASLQTERAEFARRLAQRDARRDHAARELRSARGEAQHLLVAAYMGAGATPTVDTVAFSGTDPLDYTYQATLVQDSTDARYRAATYYEDLRAQASEAVRSTVAHLDGLDRSIALTRLALGEAEDAIRTAAVVLAQAEAAEAAAAAAAAAPPAASAPPPGSGWVPLGQWPGGPSYAQWSALRQCESGGNYRAVSPSGLYRGAFQFDLSTWASVGGSGDPAMASPAEQDHRAQLLWSQRGPSPWPVCGRYLS